MGVDLHIRIETQRPSEKWCIAFEALDYECHSRRAEAIIIGGNGSPLAWSKEDSLGFDFGIPDNSPYYALSGDEYVPFSWAPWPLVLERAARLPMDKLAAQETSDWGLLEWVETVDRWRIVQGFAPEQVRAICGHW